VKILGFLEDEEAIPTLLAFSTRAKNAPSVRQEALIALRFLLGGADATRGKKDARSTAGKAPVFAAAIDALIEAAGDDDRALAQTALHTLASLKLPRAAMMRLEKIVTHPDVDRARLALEMLGGHEGPEAARA